ncbi:MAG TPA: fibronectin type III domain-containing protein, partial [Thermodesulfobacteriota bacterium]|nr:fibronectin type III domain-containing protein [Thermodesulfobacteriota bacterium]
MTHRLLAQRFYRWSRCMTYNSVSSLFRLSVLMTAGILFITLFASPARAGSVTLAWDPGSSPENDNGYKIYYRTASSQMMVKDVGKVTSCTLDGLKNGQTYRFAATAYGSDGRETGYSNIVTHTVSTSVSTRSAETIAASDLTVVTASPTE